MSVKVQKVNPPAKRRVIVISDIHANLILFQKLLTLINFTKEDILVLLGDIVEKGTKSLETLQYVMELSNTHTVYGVCGNCDDICLELKRKGQNEALLNYLLLREHTLIGEMCRAQNMKLTKEFDMAAAKQKLSVIYKKEINFIEKLPHILKLGILNFAHAAIYPILPEQMEKEKVMKVDGYMNLGYQFEQLHIVGHWPVSLYCDKIPNHNPRYDKKSKIVSIDGGNIVKQDGQLNVLIFEDAYTEKFTYQSLDLLPRAIAKTNQEENTVFFHIRWNDSLVIIQEQKEEVSFCKHKSTGHLMWIPNDFLYEQADGWHTEDISDYRLKIMAGDEISVFKETQYGYLIKKDGISGWYFGKLEWL